jgi:hypothetical protein
MKKVFRTVLVGAVLAGPAALGVAAGATPAVPSGAPAAPRANTAVTLHGSAAQAQPGFCLQVGSGGRYVCVLHAPPQGCVEGPAIGYIVNYNRCSYRPHPKTPGNCTNPFGNRGYTCLGSGTPNGKCTETASLLIIHHYRCSADSNPGQLIKLR